MFMFSIIYFNYSGLLVNHVVVRMIIDMSDFIYILFQCPNVYVFTYWYVLQIMKFERYSKYEACQYMQSR